MVNFIKIPARNRSGIGGLSANTGFTLIELTLVLAITAVLITAALAWSNYNAKLRAARLTGHTYSIIDEAVQGYMETYYSELLKDHLYSAPNNCNQLAWGQGDAPTVVPAADCGADLSRPNGNVAVGNVLQPTLSELRDLGFLTGFFSETLPLPTNNIATAGAPRKDAGGNVVGHFSVLIDRDNNQNVLNSLVFNSQPYFLNEASVMGASTSGTAFLEAGAGALMSQVGADPTLANGQLVSRGGWMSQDNPLQNRSAAGDTGVLGILAVRSTVNSGRDLGEYVKRDGSTSLTDNWDTRGEGEAKNDFGITTFKIAATNVSAKNVDIDDDGSLTLPLDDSINADDACTTDRAITIGADGAILICRNGQWVSNANANANGDKSWYDVRLPGQHVNVWTEASRGTEGASGASYIYDSLTSACFAGISWYSNTQSVNSSWNRYTNYYTPTGTPDIASFHGYIGGVIGFSSDIEADKVIAGEGLFPYFPDPVSAAGTGGASSTNHVFRTGSIGKTASGDRVFCTQASLGGRTIPAITGVSTEDLNALAHYPSSRYTTRVGYQVKDLYPDLTINSSQLTSGSSTLNLQDTDYFSIEGVDPVTGKCLAWKADGTPVSGARTAGTCQFGSEMEKGAIKNQYRPFPYLKPSSGNPADYRSFRRQTILMHLESELRVDSWTPVIIPLGDDQLNVYNVNPGHSKDYSDEWSMMPRYKVVVSPVRTNADNETWQISLYLSTPDLDGIYLPGVTHPNSDYRDGAPGYIIRFIKNT